MNAIVARDFVRMFLTSVLPRGQNLLRVHWPEYVCKCCVLFLGHLQSNVAKCAQMQVVLIQGPAS